MKAFLTSAAMTGLLLLTSCSHKPETTFVTAPAVMRDLTVSVTATGTIEPVTKVEVGTQVSGIIDKIYVDYNSVVHKGDIIAELDKTNLLSELSNAQSNLANAQSSLNYQKANYERYKTLFDRGLIAANVYEQARLDYDKAVQQLAIEKQNVTKAQTNVGYATITAPIDGVVLSKEVEEGQTVASAMTTPTLFIIAQDLTDMRVIADVDEADIGNVCEGQNVSFTVDAFPDDVFRGVVTQVRQEATTESNVVTYEVVISAPNEDLKLKPGLTANVTIYTLEKHDVLCIPAKALKFKPNDETLPAGDTIIDCTAASKVWTLNGNDVRAVAVEVGAIGGSIAEITSGLNPGEEVITDVVVPMSIEEEKPNPFMPGPRRNNNDKKKNK